MLVFEKARLLAETWVRCVCGDRVELVRASTIAKPYGWVFFYQSSDFLITPDDFSAALAGNAPFIIDRYNGQITVFGTSLTMDQYLENFEQTLPPARMYAKPEQPVWS